MFVVRNTKLVLRSTRLFCTEYVGEPFICEAQSADRVKPRRRGERSARGGGSHGWGGDEVRLSFEGCCHAKLHEGVLGQWRRGRSRLFRRGRR